MFSCESSEIFKNTYYEEHLRKTNISYSAFLLTFLSYQAVNVSFLQNFANVLTTLFLSRYSGTSVTDA